MVRRPKSKEARTRGPNLDEPLNRGLTPKAKRTMVDLLGEHRMEMLYEAKELGRAAATEFEAAQHFGVSLMTVRMWKARDPGFEKALTHYQNVGDGRVEASLYDRAVGYSFRSEEIKVIDDQVVRVPIVKHVEPNVTAQIFWLKNRQRQRWRDVQDHKVEGSVDVNVKQEDPRALAMAIIAALRDATAAADDEPAVIEHEPKEAAE